MKEYVLDANAVLRYFGVGAGPGGDKVRGLFEQAERNQARLSMSVINLGEVLYVLLKHVGEGQAFEYLKALRHGVALVDADEKENNPSGAIKASIEAWVCGQLCSGAGVGVEGNAGFRGPGL